MTTQVNITRAGSDCYMSQILKQNVHAITNTTCINLIIYYPLKNTTTNVHVHKFYYNT